MSVRDSDLGFVADQITMQLGYLEVILAHWSPPLPWSCQGIVEGQERGEDPTGPWRDTVTGIQGRMYDAATAPPQVGAAFVMQWYLGVVANPLAWAAVTSPYVLNADPAALRFDLTPDSWYPCSVSIVADRVLEISDEADRLALAQARYREHADRFEKGYRPGVKTGSRQRRGMVNDAWTMAVESARGTFSLEPDRLTLRESCCFIYTLPGAQACARCPRRAGELTAR